MQIWRPLSTQPYKVRIEQIPSNFFPFYEQALDTLVGVAP